MLQICCGKYISLLLRPTYLRVFTVYISFSAQKQHIKQQIFARTLECTKIKPDEKLRILTCYREVADSTFGRILCVWASCSHPCLAVSSPSDITLLYDFIIMTASATAVHGRRLINRNITHISVQYVATRGLSATAHLLT